MAVRRDLVDRSRWNRRRIVDPLRILVGRVGLVDVLTGL